MGKGDPIIATASQMLEPVTTTPQTPPRNYLAVANALMPGVKALAVGPLSACSLALLAAHALECMLSAYLSRNGSDADLRKPGLLHNIVGLWGQAVADGLPVQSTPPDWVEDLSRVHVKPFHLRYMRGLNGILLPAPEPMATELAELLEVVKTAIK
ncbi:MAG TPA: hypothetical protein VFP43_13685 [Mesorhizobium sp.]|nr:hypothetical protein [Mesorhizobium sp.]